MLAEKQSRFSLRLFFLFVLMLAFPEFKIVFLLQHSLNDCATTEEKEEDDEAAPSEVLFFFLYDKPATSPLVQ